MNVFPLPKERFVDAVELFKVSEIELVYKNRVQAKDRVKIKTSIDAYELLMQQWDENKLGFVEQAKILLLNRANQALGICEVSTGGTTGTVIDPRIVFAAAIKANACGVILSHNHPSGNLQASNADIALTEKLKQAGKFLEINVLDHLIISTEGYYSFSDDMIYTSEYLCEHYKDRNLPCLQPPF